MKQFLIIGLILGLAATAFADPPLATSRDYLFQNTLDSVGLTVQKSGTVTSNFLEFYSGSNLKFSVPSNGIISVANGGTGTNSTAGIASSLNVLASSNAVATGITLAGQTTNSGLSASLPVFTDGALVFTNQTIANSKLKFGIQSGTATNGNNLTVTNTFSVAFASAPNVVATTQTTNKVSVSSITASNFISGADATNLTFQWIAIGAP